ncbi:MAG: GNAT family protein [Bryobacteraceae bacterium]
MGVRLRVVEEADAEALFSLVWNSPVTANLIWDGPSSLGEYRNALRDFAEKTADGKLFAFTIEVHGAPAGCLSLHPAADGHKASIGLWIGVPYQGKGHGTAAIGLAARYAFENLPIHRLEAMIFTGNTASRRAFEKNAFSLEGTLREAVKKSGEFRDEWVMSLLRREWRPGR